MSAGTTNPKMDREVGLVVIGALALLFGWLLITNTQPVAQKVFDCEQVQSMDGVKTVVTCETSPTSILEVQIGGAALGICGIVTVLVGAVNWSR